MRRALASLAILGLLAPPASVGPSAAHHVPAAKRTRHPRIYGTLMDPNPATATRLDVYIKTHHAHHYVYMTGATVVKVRTQVVHRSTLTRGLYVIVTCMRQPNGELQALTVHIEYRHARKKAA